ncbi:DUF1707 domain-containing protein [Actinophytocola sp.]|uniref:DUF1707 domain-containing protein n=1 Tax=Actinophytocola sp. TaxID=1872138 RepID=UPI002ED09422
MQPDETDSTWADSADRKVVLRALAEHREEERLTETEYERRRDLARKAQTQGDLRALFADLPPPHPLIGEAPAARRPRINDTGVLLISGGAVVVAAVIAGWWAPALIFSGVLAVATVLTTARKR